jgi:hypothetical protein
MHPPRLYMFQWPQIKTHSCNQCVPWKWTPQLVQVKKNLLLFACGDQKVFGCHNCMVIEMFSFGFCVFGCPLTPSHETFGELRWSSPWWRAIFFAFCEFLDHIKPLLFKILIIFNNSCLEFFWFYVIQHLTNVVEWIIEQTTTERTIVGQTTIKRSIWPKPLKQVIPHIF